MAIPLQTKLVKMSLKWLHKIFQWHQKDHKKTEKIPLKFIAYVFGLVEPKNFETQSEYLMLLKEWGFKINPLNKTITVMVERKFSHPVLKKVILQTKYFFLTFWYW